MFASGWFGVWRQNLNEHLAFPDHAQIAPGTLLERAGAGLKVLDFGGQRGIARAQALVDLALFSNLPLKTPDAKPPALT